MVADGAAIYFKVVWDFLKLSKVPFWTSKLIFELFDPSKLDLKTDFSAERSLNIGPQCLQSGKRSLNIGPQCLQEPGELNIALLWVSELIFWVSELILWVSELNRCTLGV